MTIDEIHKNEFNLMKEFRQIMDANHLEYWLAYGTCLGAARHQGFIPWDDDVDVYISGQEFGRFIDVFSNIKSDIFELHFFGTNNYPFVFPKLVSKKIKIKETKFQNLDYVGGIYIDIFPLFEISNSWVLRQFQYLFLKINRVIIDSHNGCCRNKKIQAFFKIFDFKKAQKRLLKFYSRKWSKNKRFLCEPLQYSDNTKWAKIHKKTNFVSNEKLFFNGVQFKVPFKWDAYLVDQYGDWRVPPPEKERTGHSIVVVEENE